MNVRSKDVGAGGIVLDEPDADANDLRTAKRLASVYVHETPVRVWHWLNALAIVVRAVTGYLIANPLPTLGQGEASDSFLFGYVRFAHFAAAYVLTIGFLGRAFWAIVGNHHAQQLFYLPVWSREWWHEVWFEVRRYLFMGRRPKKYLGHNPLAQLAMFGFIALGTSFMIVTGFALYGEGLGAGSWADTPFGWVIPLMGSSQDVHSWHHLGMWIFVVFVIVHVYVAIREDVVSRQSIVSTMISGTRTFKDDDPD